MATKIVALLALLALSMSATTAFYTPQFSLSPTNAILPQFLPAFIVAGYEHPFAQAFRLQQALVTSILQQQIAQLQQQSSADLIVHTIAAQLQQQQFLPSFSQLALANPVVYLQLQQLLRVNPLAVARAIAFLQQQQQLQQSMQAISQLDMVNPTAYLQHQIPFNQLVVENIASFLQLQQSLPFTQFALANAAPYNLLQHVLSLNPLAVANPLVAAFWQQQQFLPFN